MGIQEEVRRGSLPPEKRLNGNWVEIVSYSTRVKRRAGSPPTRHPSLSPSPNPEEPE